MVHDGLIYRRICSESVHLKPGGYLLLEHGYDQKIQLLEMFKKKRHLYVQTSKIYLVEIGLTGNKARRLSKID